MLFFGYTSATVCADEPNAATDEAVIVTKVPSSHRITAKISGSAEVTLNGQTGTEFTADRLSQPVLAVSSNGGRIIKVLLNGEDITDDLIGEKYTFDPVYEDKVLEVFAETESSREHQDIIPDSGKKVDPSSVGGPAAPDTAPTAIGNSGDGGTTAVPTQPAADIGTFPAENVTSSAGDNPSTGFAGGVSAGTAALLLLGLFRKKRSDKDQ